MTCAGDGCSPGALSLCTPPLSRPCDSLPGMVAVWQEKIPSRAEHYVGSLGTRWNAWDQAERVQACLVDGVPRLREVEREGGKLLRGAALQEHDPVVGRDAQQRAQVRLGLLYDLHKLRAPACAARGVFVNARLMVRQGACTCRYKTATHAG